MNSNTARCRITANAAMLFKSQENSDLIISYYDKNDMSRRYSYNLTRNYPQQRRRRRQRYTTSPDYYDDRPISSDGSTLTSSSIEAMSVIILRLTYAHNTHRPHAALCLAKSPELLQGAGPGTAGHGQASLGILPGKYHR